MENKTFARAIADTRAEVEKGDTLTEAMRKHEEVFPSLLTNMVGAGEASGNLDRSFSRMAVHFEKSAKLQAMVKKAMIYPIMLFCVALIAVVVMSVFVVPKFARLFADLGSELPFITRMVMGFSNFLIYRWYIVLGVVAVFALIYRLFAKMQPVFQSFSVGKDGTRYQSRKQ